MRRVAGLFILALFLHAGPSQAASRSKGDPPPNILLIVLDDVGTDKLKPYGLGASWPRTPQLDRMSADGVRFEQCRVNPLCSPSRAALLTGRYCFRTGLGYLVGGSNPSPLAATEILLPALIKAQAPSTYATGAFGKYHIHENPAHPTVSGFDHVAGHVANVGDTGSGSHHFYWEKVTDGVPSTVGASGPPPYDAAHWSGTVTRIDAGTWMMNQSDPFFAYVAFNAPHWPYQVPPLHLLHEDTQTALHDYQVGDEATTAAESRLFFDAALEAVDKEISNLLRRIGPKLDNTVVFVIGDNGTEASVSSSVVPLAHGKRSVYEFGIRVPLFVIGPLVQHPGTVCSGLVDAVDLWRTIANIAGIDDAAIDEFVAQTAPSPTTIDSVSFVEMIGDPTAASHRARSFSEAFLPLTPQVPGFPPAIRRRAITDGRFKYVVQTISPTGETAEALFDLSSDSLEAMNLISPSMSPESLAVLQGFKSEMRTLTNSGN